MKDSELLQKAWGELGYVVPDEFETIACVQEMADKFDRILQSIDFNIINEQKRIKDIQDSITVLEVKKEEVNDMFSILNSVLHQVKVIEFKALNADKNIEVY